MSNHHSLVDNLKERQNRQFTLRYNEFKTSLDIPQEIYPVAEQFRDGLTGEFNTELEMIVEFINSILADDLDSAANLELLSILVLYLNNYFGNDIHCYVKELENKQQILKVYYGALGECLKSGYFKNLHFPRSKLLEAVENQKATLFATFGGQGNVEAYFNELVTLYDTYKPIVRSFIQRSSRTLAVHSESDEAQALFVDPIRLLDWLDSPVNRPSTTAFLATYLSLPLIGLLQLLNYYIMLKNTGKTPKEWIQYLQGTTGHSQGIVSSVVIATAETEQEFINLTQKALGLLFWMGLRAQKAAPLTTISSRIIEDSVAYQEGVPTPMLSVNGLSVQEANEHAKTTNSFLPAERQVQLALVNGPKSVIFAGHPQSLYGLNVALRRLKAGDEDVSRVPHSQRKKRFTSRFLPVTVPFHCNYIQSVPAQVEEDVKKYDLDFSGKDLKIPVYHTHTGLNLQNEPNLVSSLIEQICLLSVQWEKATSSCKFTHCIDFGPGGYSGVGSLVARNAEGSGVTVIVASTFSASMNPDILDKSVLFDRVNEVTFAPNWKLDYQPRLVRVASTNTVHIDTRFSRLIGKPPLMVAGMTPCTANEHFVSAVTNAGFHVELAGGGQHTPEILEKRVNDLMKLIPAGEGISLNILFLNPRLWGFQYPAVVRMRKRGVPMEGVCVAAGVPSIDVADEVVKTLSEAGLRFVAFKPGSVETIRRVIQIAKNHPKFPIVLQWTGGRGGGHHSFEDVHQPILETYAAIRRAQNIVLVIGSGFGDSAGTIPYLTGDWSTKFDCHPMPFDGILFGSRVMVAKENLASLGVKELIANAPGIEDEAMWERSYKGEIGGIITVKSELGEPIHKIANRGVKFWREMDQEIFSLPKEKRMAAILSKKDYIIKNLNENFQKPWFGVNDKGPCEVKEMTYKGVILRLLELLFVNGKWIDVTYRDFVFDFLVRTEERCGEAGPSVIEPSYLDEEPTTVIEAFFEAYDTNQILTQEDVLYFMHLCSIPWRKPVPFIPILDEKFEFWLKKDSLWQSENVESVVGQDPQRVAILQGPVAVKHSTKVNEPVKDILDGIYQEQIEYIKKNYYENAEIPVVEYQSTIAVSQIEQLRNVSVTETFENGDKFLMLELSNSADKLPDHDKFLDFISGPSPCWLRALLTNDHILQGKLLVPNPIKRIMRPRVNQTIFIKHENGLPTSIAVYESRKIQSRIPEREPTLVIKKDAEISVELHYRVSGKSVPLEFKFDYVPTQGLNPIHELMTERNNAIRKFYASLWSISSTSVTCEDEFTSEFTVDVKNITDFVNFIDNNSELYPNIAPLDFAIVAGWKSLVTALQPKEIHGDLLRLVHLSNEFKVLNASDIKHGDKLKTVARTNLVQISDSGKTISVSGIIYREDKALIEIKSDFLIRGTFDDFDTTFSKTIEQPTLVVLESSKDIAVLKSKKWITIKDVPVKSQLIFKLETYCRNKTANTYSLIKTWGNIYHKTSTETIKVGTVDYEATDCQGNVVLAWLKRFGSPMEVEVFFKNGYLVTGQECSVNAPLDNNGYGLASGDLNPIHVNSYFADLAQLPGTITHGMWTSASTRKFVELYAAENNPRRVKQYKVAFQGMVLPGDKLSTKMRHVGMTNGRKIIKIETVNDQGTVVLSGSAEVEQPNTAYVFTGQGSQHVGMGMDLYQTSEVAKQVWDKADAYSLKKYGISILKIVRENPKSITVFFGGKAGSNIRKHYQEMTYDSTNEDGTIKKIPIFPEIKSDSPSYTFQHPDGLLSATQFTQPALTLTAVASFLDLKANGLVQDNAQFAGHSLGEYATLAALGQVFSIEAIMDVTFYRGMTMQVAVPRDSEGRSNYGMVAVNPLRVGKTFGEKGLSFVVQRIAKVCKGLLEIVNYNVENIQYVVAGDLFCLDVLRQVLNKFRALNIDLLELVKTKTVQEVEELLDQVINEMQQITAEKKSRGVLVAERGSATIPLAGIDVPFHSSFLSNGIKTFRQVIQRRTDPRLLDISLFIDKYIPNLTAKAFNLSKEYFEDVLSITDSPIIKKILNEWNTYNHSDAACQQKLAYQLLIELLAHQFAKPVRWIETQDVLFGRFQVERLIEVGPSPVLVGMAVRTLKSKYEAYDDAVTQRRTQLCTYKNRTEIYYEFDDPVVEEVASEEIPQVQVEEKVAPPVPAPTQAQPTGQMDSIADVNIPAADILFILIANKLKKPLSDIQGSKSIKDLVGGKSTLQNEILGELANEFGNVLAEKAEELSLDEVSSQLAVSHNGSLGKTSLQLVNKMIGSKMPGGFGLGQVKTFLGTFGFGPKRIDACLLHGVLNEPQARLGSEQEAKGWLSTLASSYAQKVGVTLGSTSTQSANSSNQVVVNSEDFEKLEKKLSALLRSQLANYAKYLDFDLLESAKTKVEQQQSLDQIQTQLDLWSLEHGDDYKEGIRPKFDVRKARSYDSFWNWARQDALQLYYDLLFGKLTEIDREVMDRAIRLMNRTSEVDGMVKEFEHLVSNSKNERVQTLGTVLLGYFQESLKKEPVYLDVQYQPTKPVTTISSKGELLYSEEPREENNLKDYVASMKKGSQLTAQNDQITSIQKLISSSNEEMKPLLQNLLEQQLQISPKLPFLFLKKRCVQDPSSWEYDSESTGLYLNILQNIAETGLSFHGKHCLLTGCGRDSIGVEILKALISGGAQVVVTTSRFSNSVTKYYQSIYQKYGSKGSRLVVVPFNGGSIEDVRSVVDYIYDTKGLGWDLDIVVPFAAISEQGRELDSIDDKSELAHRVMLTNVIRMLGEIKIQKKKRGFTTRPACVLLPLSPNHGTFGGDGLYGESKLGLETLMNRFHSESWSEYLTIIGAVIGWTRGTGLMSANNIVAQGIEKLGARTFSTTEMAFNIIGLLDPRIISHSMNEPIWADLNGGLSFVRDLNVVSFNLRQELMKTSDEIRAIYKDDILDISTKLGKSPSLPRNVTPRANMKFSFPPLPKQKSDRLKGLFDLEKVVVATGFGEVGPFGGSRTRWEMEAFGEFSLEGAIEMAWIMNLITFHHGPLKKIPFYSGWIDVETNEPVQDYEVKSKYEKRILEHTGIRFIEPELTEDYDPNKKLFYQEVSITDDLPRLEVSKAEAEAFKLRHPSAVIETVDDQTFIKLLKGATILVPKALRFDRLVAGQIPTGWSAKKYGIPDDIVSQVDPVTLYTLVATAEALITSGVTDPYEFYKYVHVSELGNTCGGGMGGMVALKKMFQHRREEKDVQGDIMQESFINTMPAWVNMLLLSSSGPIKTPVGACATAAESVDIGVETILSGKAKIVICGGYDDFQEEGSYEFASMKATSNTDVETGMGREPKEMCRPATDSRGGFMEAQGAGMTVLMTAELALQMGVPIRGIIACVNTATDKNGRSIPAPGQGILTTARESAGYSPLLDIDYRRRQISKELVYVKDWVSKEYEALGKEIHDLKLNEKQIDERTKYIEAQARRKERLAKQTWSHSWNEPTIAPLRAGLAMYGLSIDDIGVASFHGTGTKANDYNESSVLDQQMKHLGRSAGNVVPAVFQKHLTGHPKGAAAAWMLNGAFQMLETGIIPGNRNLDNVEDRLQKFKYILYPSKSIHTNGIKACLLKSFGFGQAGAEILVIHPDVLYSCIDDAQFEEYSAKRQNRQLETYRYYHEMLTNTAPLVRIKDSAPYTNEQQTLVYLDPTARADFNKSSGKYGYNLSKKKELEAETLQVTNLLQTVIPSTRGVGVDIQLLDEVSTSQVFLERNFTAEEIRYCESSPCPRSSYAARWAAKEAVIKAISNAAMEKVFKSSAAPLKEIEIVRQEGLAPIVEFHGEAKQIWNKTGLKSIKLTLSHSGNYAVAAAVAIE